MVSNGKPKINYEEHQTTQDGETIWLNTSKVPLRNETGVVYGVLGTYDDITLRKRQQEEVARLRNYLANIINSMPSVLIGVDREGRITQWNSEAQQATGITFNGAMGKPLVEVFPRLSNKLDRINDAIRLRRMQVDTKRAHQRNGGLASKT